MHVSVRINSADVTLRIIRTTYVSYHTYHTCTSRINESPPGSRPARIMFIDLSTPPLAHLAHLPGITTMMINNVDPYLPVGCIHGKYSILDVMPEYYLILVCVATLLLTYLVTVKCSACHSILVD